MTEETNALALPDAGQFQRDIMAINQFQQIVHANMIEGHDYGVIPGTSKPTLLKPGAEKIAKLLGLSDQYEIMNTVEDWDKPLFRYMVKCTLKSVRNQVIISEGLGECNSMENKYRWRDAKIVCPECGVEGAIIKGKKEYGGGWLCFAKKGGCGTKWADGDTEIQNLPKGKVPNDDIYSLINTILKMAKKRALVDAALSAGRLSDLFTQDMEDITGVVVEAATIQEPPQPPADLTSDEFKEKLAGFGIKNKAEIYATLAITPKDFKAKYPTRESVIAKLKELKLDALQEAVMADAIHEKKAATGSCMKCGEIRGDLEDGFCPKCTEV